MAQLRTFQTLSWYNGVISLSSRQNSAGSLANSSDLWPVGAGWDTVKSKETIPQKKTHVGVLEKGGKRGMEFGTHGGV